MFQHTAARRRLDIKGLLAIAVLYSFNTQPPEGGWVWDVRHVVYNLSGFNTQPPEGGWNTLKETGRFFIVSTHSRPKAAGKHYTCVQLCLDGFNTQPPEGGWLYEFRLIAVLGRFNTQPPEGGWIKGRLLIAYLYSFNTQPPEGGWAKHLATPMQHYLVSTHSRPKAAGGSQRHGRIAIASFNTQPPEGGWALSTRPRLPPKSFNTQPPEGGWYLPSYPINAGLLFQHTAARRRLG